MRGRSRRCSSGSSPIWCACPRQGPDYRDKLAPLVAALGYRAWASTAQGTSDGEGVVLLAAERMGELHVTSGPELRHRYLRATGGALGARAFYAIHPEAPMSPSRTAWWRADLAHIARWCAQSPAPIVAGDFNATADNALLRAALRHCPQRRRRHGPRPRRHVPGAAADLVRHPDRPRARPPGFDHDPVCDPAGGGQ